MDEDKAARFISSLVKSLQALCNGFVDFSSSVEVIGHIHLNIDRSVKLDYVLTEEVSKSPSEGATVFASHSYHSQPPSSASSKSGSDTSNHGQKSRKDKEADPLGLSALPREVPNTSKSDSHPHSSNRESSNSSHSFSGNVGFSRDSESDSAKHENSRLSCQFEESANRRRKMGPLSQRTPSPAAKRSRVSDFGPGARTVVKEAGFEVIEIKEEPEEEPSVFFGGSGGMASGQDIQTPDFSNVVMESLERVDKLEKGGDLVGGDGGDVMSGPQQPVFPVMFHPSDGMPSSSAGPIPGPSDSQPVASTSGVVCGDWNFSETKRTVGGPGRELAANYPVKYESVDKGAVTVGSQYTHWVGEQFDPPSGWFVGVSEAEELERIRIRRERVKLRVRAHRARKRAAQREAQKATEAALGAGPVSVGSMKSHGSCTEPEGGHCVGVSSFVNSS